MTTLIKADNLTKRYKLGKDNYVHALRGASFSVDEGEMVAIVGPSGSGKSTLMHITGGLDVADSGEIVIGDARVDTLRGKALAHLRGERIGFVFQGFNLIPTLSALDNVALPAEYLGVKRADAHARARKLLEDFGLGDRLNHTPSELSGGQQQRVAICRALVNDPKVVMGDEPAGDLDTKTTAEVLAMLREINHERGTTFVLVTHDPEVAAFCDRIVRVRDGVVEDDGRERVAAETA